MSLLQGSPVGLFQTAHMGQRLEMLDTANPMPGPAVSGIQAYMIFLLTGRPEFRVVEICS